MISNVVKASIDSSEELRWEAQKKSSISASAVPIDRGRQHDVIEPAQFARFSRQIGTVLYSKHLALIRSAEKMV